MTSRRRSHPVADGRASRWAGQRDKRRAEIVDAALEAIEEHGPYVSTTQIAASAGIARPKLYRHFADADDLYRAIVQRAAELIASDMASVLTPSGGTIRQIVDGSVYTFVLWLDRHANLYRYVMRRVADGDARGDVLGDIKAALASRIGALMHEYMRMFEVRTVLVGPLASGLIGLVESATDRWIADPEELSLTDFADSVSSWIWAVLDQALRRSGARLDPDVVLPGACGSTNSHDL